MNSTFVRRSISLIASVLVSFAVVEGIAQYAIPADAPQLLAKTEKMAAAPAAAPRPAR